jgi:hypothetical protein
MARTMLKMEEKGGKIKIYFKDEATTRSEAYSSPFFHLFKCAVHFNSSIVTILARESVSLSL